MGLFFRSVTRAHPRTHGKKTGGRMQEAGGVEDKVTPSWWGWRASLVTAASVWRSYVRVTSVCCVWWCCVYFQVVSAQSYFLCYRYRASRRISLDRCSRRCSGRKNGRTDGARPGGTAAKWLILEAHSATSWGREWRYSSPGWVFSAIPHFPFSPQLYL